KASNPDAYDRFGYAAALSGDTAVISAYSEDSNAIGVNGDQSDNSAEFSGAAYVFTRNGTNWSQEAYLKASNTDATDLFGESLSISGVMILVGSRQESSNARGINVVQWDNSGS